MQPLFVHQPPQFPGLVVAKLSTNTIYVRMARVHNAAAVEFVVACLRAESERFVMFLHFDETLVMVRPSQATHASMAVMEKAAGLVLLGHNRVVHIVAKVLAGRRTTAVNTLAQAHGALLAYGAQLPPIADFLARIAALQPAADE